MGRTGRWLKAHDLQLSLDLKAGVSYFGYNTKAIEPNFATSEISLELLLSRPIADNWMIQTGFALSHKGTKAPSYDYSSQYKQLYDMLYGLEDIDQTVSLGSHRIWSMPLKVQYHPGRLGLTVGGSFRYFSGSYYRTYNQDFLSGKFDAGVIGGVGLPIGNFRLGAEYYYGLVNVRKGYYISFNSVPAPEYKLFNRAAQVTVRYTFHQPNRKTGNAGACNCSG